MRGPILPLLYICLLPLCMKAQEVELGGFFGIATYQGDLAEEHIELGETKLSTGFIIKYHINPYVVLKGSVFNGRVTGNDANSPSLADRGWSFHADIREYGTMLEYNILGIDRYNRIGKFDFAWTPYVFSGLIFSRAEAILNVPETDAHLFPETRDTSNFFGFPVGGGMRLDISEFTSLGVEYGWRAIFSDYLDSVSVNGRQDKNDWYSFGGITLTFFIGQNLQSGTD